MIIFVLNSGPKFPEPVHYDDSLDDIVDALERLGGDLEQRDHFQLTPLMRAVREDRLDLVKRLLRAGANVNAVFKGNFMEKYILPDRKRIILLAALEHYSERTLNRNRFEIIKCLIKAGSALESLENQHGHGVREDRFRCQSTPLHAACWSGFWPVVVELLQAGSQVDMSCSAENTLLTALREADIADREEKFNQELPAVSGIDVVMLLIDRCPTLRLKSYYDESSAFGYVVRKPSPSFVLMFLQSGKPAHGVEERADKLDFTGFPRIKDPFDEVVLDIPDEILPRLRVRKMLHGRRGTPLQHSLASLLHCMYYPFEDDGKYSWRIIRRHFVIMGMLLDAGVTAHTLDFNSRQFLYCVREWLDNRLPGHAKRDESGVAMAYQVLDEAQRWLNNPRRLDQLCRTQVRHYLNIRGVNVQDFGRRRAVSHVLQDFLLYDDVSESQWFGKTM